MTLRRSEETNIIDRVEKYFLSWNCILISAPNIRGQLMSKCLFWCLNSFKKWTKKKFDLRYHISSRFFLEEFRIAKSNFEINWYLLEVYANNQLAAQTFTSLVITIEIMFISMRTNLKKTPAFSKLYSYFLVILDIQIHFYLIKDTFNLLFIKLCYNFKQYLFKALSLTK